MDSLPSAIGRYEVQAFIARGGMGTLYLARDPVLHRQVAIKLLREADNDDLRARFTREARSAANLRHRNIVTIFDVGEHNNQPFMAMEYIQGQTLSALIGSDPPPSIIRRLELVEELCDGLAYAHRQGVVHRDVKPANLMVDAEGTLKILDFGIARAAAESGMTQAGLLVGTLSYMSPEQVAGTPIDGRSDMFAVGAVMYELLTFRQAFPGSIDSGVLNRILSGEPEPPLDVLFPHLDPAIGEIVRTALQKRPADRFADLQQMRAAVQRARRALEDSVQPELDQTIASLPDQTTRATPSPSRRGADRDEIARRRAQQIEAHVAAARQALEEQRFDDTIKYCEDVLLLDPNESRALDLSDRARLKRDEEGARELVNQARQHLKGGNLTSASSCVKEALALIPSSSDALEMSRLIGEARLAHERERQRMAAIQDALSRGRAALDRGEPEAAIAATAEALALAPGHDDALRLREEAQQAIETRERAARDAKAQETVDEARALFAEGLHDDALSVLEQFWPAHPKVSHAWTELSAEAARLEAERSATTLAPAPATIRVVPPGGTPADDRTVFVPRGPSEPPPPPSPVVERTIITPPPQTHPPVVEQTIAIPPPPVRPSEGARHEAPPPPPPAKADSPSGEGAEPPPREPAVSVRREPKSAAPPPIKAEQNAGTGNRKASVYAAGALVFALALALVAYMFLGGGKTDGPVAVLTTTTTLAPPTTAPPSTASAPIVTSTTTSLPAPSTTTTSTTSARQRTTTTSTTMPVVQIPPTTLPVRPTTTLPAITTTTSTTTLPPTTTTSTTAAPTTTLPRAALPPVNEQPAIERMLAQYSAAFEKKDIDTITRLHPSIGDAALTAIRDSKSYIVTIFNIRVTLAANGSTATVTAMVRTENRPPAGATLRSTESTQFQLEKRGATWVITSRRRQ